MSLCVPTTSWFNIHLALKILAEVILSESGQQFCSKTETDVGVHQHSIALLQVGIFRVKIELQNQNFWSILIGWRILRNSFHSERYKPRHPKSRESTKSDLFYAWRETNCIDVAGDFVDPCVASGDWSEPMEWYSYGRPEIPLFWFWTTGCLCFDASAGREWSLAGTSSLQFWWDLVQVHINFGSSAWFGTYGPKPQLL